MVERKRGGFEPKKNSIAHRKDRLGEGYDGSESALRSQIVVSNSYNLFLRHQPSKGWFRKYSNEYLKGNGQGICGKCMYFLTSFWVDLSLILSIGFDSFADDDLVVTKFFLQRIFGTISTPADVDNINLNFDVHVCHVECVTPEAWVRYIIPSSDGFHFSNTVYFHPNVRTDGWEAIKGIHEAARDAYGKDTEVATGKGKKGKGKGKGKSVSFPLFPPQPRFWDHTVTGSEIGLWPPRLFNEWVTSAQQGVTLSLDPTLLNVAGPSNSNPPKPSSLRRSESPSLPRHSESPSSSERSPSFNPSSTRPSQQGTQKLPTPPRFSDSWPDGFELDEDEMGSDNEDI